MWPHGDITGGHVKAVSVISDFVDVPISGLVLPGDVPVAGVDPAGDEAEPLEHAADALLQFIRDYPGCFMVLPGHTYENDRELSFYDLFGNLTCWYLAYTPFLEKVPDPGDWISIELPDTWAHQSPDGDERKRVTTILW